MTPEQQKELWDWYQARKVQQLEYPLDQASKSGSGFAAGEGKGSTALTQVYTDSHSDTVTAPKAYAQTVLVRIGGILYEIPSLI